MAKYLIVYGTKEGQTAKIAEHIGEVMRNRGYQTDVYDARQIKRRYNEIAIEEYRGVLVGSSIHMLRWSSAAHQFVYRNLSRLDKVPSGFFSVSMTAASKTEEERAQLKPYVEKFFEKTGWHPKIVGSFAGAILYTKYGFLTRYVMQSIARSKNEETDASKDYEYTDWDQVTQFAENFIKQTNSTSA